MDQQQVQTIQGQLHTMQQQLQTIQLQVNTMQQQMNTIQQQLQKLKPKVVLLQTDNRTDCDYKGLTGLVNSSWIEYMNKNEKFQAFRYEYVFKFMDPHYYENMHPAMGKIYVIQEYLLSNPDVNMVIFLDSDAWLNNPSHLHDLLTYLFESKDYHGAFSRDPYLKKNTYINSGSFIIKNNEFIRNMYNTICQFAERDKRFHHYYINDEYGPYIFDQYYISQTVYENRSNLLIFHPEILNTPFGRILRHNWCKNCRMFSDMYEIMDIIRGNSHVCNEKFDICSQLDKEDFPSMIDEGRDYNV